MGRGAARGFKRKQTTLPAPQAVLLALLLAILAARNASAAATDAAEMGSAAGGAATAASAAGGKAAVTGTEAVEARPAGLPGDADDEGELIGDRYGKPEAAGGDQGAAAVTSKTAGPASGKAPNVTAGTSTEGLSSAAGTGDQLPGGVAAATTTGGAKKEAAGAARAAGTNNAANGPEAGAFARGDEDGAEPGTDVSYDGPEIVVRASEEVRRLRWPACMLLRSTARPLSLLGLLDLCRILSPCMPLS